MPEENKIVSAVSSIGSLSSIGFEEMYYFISVDRDKVDLERFLVGIGAQNRNPLTSRASVSVAPKDEKSGEYHIEASWYTEEREINFKVTYELGPTKHGSGASETYAERFMEWFGSFFKYESAHSHSHGHFIFPLETRQSKFPLPLKTSLAGDAEIDGISLRLPTRPEGVSKVRLTQGKSQWYVEVIADRRITFKEFSPYAEINTYLSAIDMLMEERKS